VQVIGVNIDAIRRGEDRQEFKDTMTRLGIGMPRSEIAPATRKPPRRETDRPSGRDPAAYTMGGRAAASSTTWRSSGRSRTGGSR